MGGTPQPPLEPQRYPWTAGGGEGGEFTGSGFPLLWVLFSSAGSGGQLPWLSLDGPCLGVLTSRLWRPWMSENVLLLDVQDNSGLVGPVDQGLPAPVGSC